MSGRQAHRPVPVRQGRPLRGAIAGAICGLITYWSGAFLLVSTELRDMARSELVAELSQPFTTYTYWEIVLVVVGAFLGGMVARYRWHSAGLLSYIGLISMISGFLVYSVTVSLPQVPLQNRWLSYVLLVAEAGGLGLIALFSFYTLDAGTRRNWSRRPEKVPYDPEHRPVVALEVPVFNEDPEMVERTIDHLIDQDYPRDRFLVVVCDDSTDEAVRDRLAAYCKKVGAHHVTREERRGFKAGALNHATRLLAPEVEFIAVIDCDYWVAPDYLRSVVGYFTDPKLAFVQTPQDYRNLDESFLTRRYKRAEAYFYHGIMLSRNEENTIIFCGTMGMMRRTAFEEIGGFAEDQICEDAEISVRIAAAGWSSLYVDQSFGRGLMPAVFEAYKKQFYRWAFGNVKILFSRTWLILRSPMRKRQKLDYLVSNLHWFDGFFVTAIAGILLYLGLSEITGLDAVTHHQREIALLAVVPAALLLDGIIRLHIVLGRAGRVSIRETLLVQGMWFAIKFTNMVAVMKCMLGFKTPFVRTPKTPGHRLGIVRSAFRSVRLTKFETLMGSALVTVAVLNVHQLYQNGATWANYLLPMWLTLYGTFFLTAPAYAYLSYRTLGPGPKPVRQARSARRRARAPAKQARRGHRPPRRARPGTPATALRQHRPSARARVPPPPHGVGRRIQTAPGRR